MLEPVGIRGDGFQSVGDQILQGVDAERIGKSVQLDQLFGREGLPGAVVETVRRGQRLVIEPVCKVLECRLRGVREAEARLGVVGSRLLGCGEVLEAAFVCCQQLVHPFLDAPLVEGRNVGGFESRFEHFVYPSLKDIAAVQLSEALKFLEEDVRCRQLLGRMSVSALAKSWNLVLDIPWLQAVYPAGTASSEACVLSNSHASSLCPWLRPTTCPQRVEIRCTATPDE